MTKKEQFVHTFKRLRDCLNRYYELDKAWYDSYMFNIELYKNKYPKVFQNKNIDSFLEFYCNFTAAIYRPYFSNRFKEWFNKSQYYKQFNLVVKDNTNELRSLLLYNSNFFFKKVTKVGTNVYSFYFPYFLDLQEVEKIARQPPYNEYLPTIELKRITGSTSYSVSFGYVESRNSRINACQVGLYKMITQSTTEKVRQNILNQAEKEIPLNIKAFCELIDSMHSDMMPLQKQIIDILNDIEITKNDFLKVYYDPEIIALLNTNVFTNAADISNSLFPIKQTCTDYYDIKVKINTLLSWLQEVNRINDFSQIRNDLNVGTFTKGRERNFNLLTDSELETFQEALQDEYIPSTEGFITYATEIYSSFGASPTFSHVSAKVAAIKSRIEMFDLPTMPADSEAKIEDNFLGFKASILRIVRTIGYYDIASKRLTRSYLKIFKADIEQLCALVIVLLRISSYHGKAINFSNLLNLMYFSSGPSYVFEFNETKIKSVLTQIVNTLDYSDLSFAKLSLDLLKVLYIIELCYNYRTQPNHIDEIPF